MTGDTLMAWMRRHEVAVCILCGGSSGHPPITDDGPARCYPCVLREGRLASDPLHAPVTIVAETWEAHADVIELRACREHGQCWSWTETWPREHDFTLVSGEAL